MRTIHASMIRDISIAGFTLACEAQTHFRSSLLSLRKIATLFFGGREATTGNASALRRLALHSLSSVIQMYLEPILSVKR